MDKIFPVAEIPIPALDEGWHVICLGRTQFDINDDFRVFAIVAEEPAKEVGSKICIPHVLVHYQGEGFREVEIISLAFHEGGYPSFLQVEGGTTFTFPPRNSRTRPSISGAPSKSILLW